MPIWDQFVQLLEESLKLINQWVGNPGVAIIIFTLIVKVLTLPLTLKSITAYRNLKTADYIDIDATQYEIGDVFVGVHQNQLSQESRALTRATASAPSPGFTT